MKIVFFGSDDFALRNLEEVCSSEHEVVACVTQPDRPKGRNLQLTFSDLKQFALKNNIPVLQPEKVGDTEFLYTLKTFEADCFVVVAYGCILPQEVLDIPQLGSYNVHASLLPKYRGAAPINWAIINGDKETGVSIIQMNAQMDAGDVVAQQSITIDDGDDSASLRVKLADLGAKTLVDSLKDIEKNACTLQQQDSTIVTFAAKLTKDLGRIDWKKDALAIHNLVRGLVPWPSAFTQFKGKMLKILKTEILDQDFKDAKPGEIAEISKQGFVIKTADKGLLVQEVHLESAKRMDAHSFAAGHKIKVGDSLDVS